MYKSDLIPSTYNHIAEISDNYVVWVQQSKLNSGTSYSAYIQYLKPSFYVLPVDNYRITKGDTMSFDYNYVNNGYGGSYIDSADYNFSLTTMSPDSDYISNNNYENADFPDYFVCQFIIVIIFLWVFKQLSRIFFKGGLW